jgi:hypothetical protein
MSIGKEEDEASSPSQGMEREQPLYLVWCFSQEEGHNTLFSLWKIQGGKTRES